MLPASTSHSISEKDASYSILDAEGHEIKHTWETQREIWEFQVSGSSVYVIVCYWKGQL